MKAAVLHGREDVRIEKLEVPRLGPGDVLLRTRVALTCGTDVKVFRRGYHARMIRPPAVFGHEVAGVVEAVGTGVEHVRPGAAVVAANSAPCDECLFCRRGRPALCDDLTFWNGAYAEFVRIPARVARRNMLPLEEGIGFREAAMVEPLACAVRGVDDSGIEAGHTVAVIGAGPIGLMLTALAVRRGAHVVVAGRNRGRLEKALELGAADVVDLSGGEDPAELLSRLGPDHGGPDVVIEAVGLSQTSQAALRAVRKGGTVNLFAGCPADTQISIDSQRLHYEELTIRSTFHHTPQSVRAALQLIASGEIDPRRFITGAEPLDRLPEVLDRMARGADGLKTAILTWGSL